MLRAVPSLLAVSFLAAACSVTLAGDWPQWRGDAQRSASTPDDLPKQLRQAWVRELPKLRPAWSDQPKMKFDVAYEPIVLGQRLFVGSSHDDSLTAYDTRTGEELWRYYANGPIRFAPAAANNKVYFVSDDGYLYCLQAEDGTLAWRFRGGPSDRMVLGNERLISTWPARGAPVIADGKVYFAAGIWPFMGIFLHALDAETGAVIWTNDGDGSQYIKQPHNTDSFAGVAPQGPLVVIGDKLLVPGGRSVPACYDRITGKMLYYQLAENGKRGGGSGVAASNKFLFNGGAIFDLATEKYLDGSGELIAFAGDELYDYNAKKLRVFDQSSGKVVSVTTVDRKGKETKEEKLQMSRLGETDTGSLTALMAAGSRVYVGKPGRLLAYDLPLGKDAPVVWEAKIEGTPTSLIAADDKLFAVSLEGRIYSFSSDGPDTPKEHRLTNGGAAVANASGPAHADAMLDATGIRDGYALFTGAADSDTLLEAIQNSELRGIVLQQDAKKALQLRYSIQAAGLSADRLAVLPKGVEEVELPLYFASLIVATELPESTAERSAAIAKLYQSLRPFGGTLYLPVDANDASETARAIEQLQLVGAKIRSSPGCVLVVREGALPGSANWTHEHADAANTRVSRDTLVKAPLGLLWFGGSSNDAILPRHGHGPQPQVVDGRLFIEGLDVLRATDIYTGRVLWETSLPGLGKLYNNTAHQPGANAAGTNYIATPRGVYVAYESSCLELDPATGKEVKKFQLPPTGGSIKPPTWGYLNVADDIVIGGADPLIEAGFGKIEGDNDNYSSSQQLVVMDRLSGKVLWSIQAKCGGFRHNAICIGGGRLYCIDRLSGAQLNRLKRRGEQPKHPPRLLVLDLQTGKELWSTDQDVFGTWLSYSVERDVLVESGRTARDTLTDEPKGMRAYGGAEGKVLWFHKNHAGPAMIHHDTILMAGNACDLLTGAPRMREHPLTGEPVEWAWSRNYGCNTPMASEHLLTFRSGAAGYFDFCNDGGTGNFGGFRSSCTNNLVVAGGVLSAPDYTRTCTCSYQNQTSLALVPMDDVEIWTSFGAQAYGLPVRRLGINLGAPGDRKSDNGTLWLEYPSVGGSSPPIDIEVAPKTTTWFRRHSSQVGSETGMSWVAASGATGLTTFKVTLGDKKSAPRNYKVRLHFVEPEDLEPGERVFDVRMQGKPVVESLDIAREAGGSRRGLVKEFSGVSVADSLSLEFVASPSSKQAAVLSGIEIEAEGW